MREREIILSPNDINQIFKTEIYTKANGDDRKDIYIDGRGYLGCFMY